MEFRHRHVTAGDTSLAVVEAGDPAAPPVLFLPGRGERAVSWEPMMCAAAASRRRAVAVDLPGPPGSSRVAAETVRLLAEGLGLRRPVLVGHAAGGMVAYAYLRRFSDLDRAVLISTAVPGVAPWADVPPELAVEAADNELAAADGPAPTPLLYLLGEHEGGDPDAIVKGFAEAGVADVAAARVPGAGAEPHLAAPAAVWELIAQ